MTPKNRKKAISYQRFSHMMQTGNDSIRRQSDAALNWCLKNNADLIDVYTDLGISGYSGKHVEKGELGEILEAIHSGLIAENTYLLVENLDRLSREEIHIAQSRFIEILSKNVILVTLFDGKIYNRESLNNMGDLIIALVSMARANEESQIKSERVLNAKAAKRKKIEQGIPTGGNNPMWIDYKPKIGQFRLNKHAKDVQFIFSQYIAGVSALEIARQLNDKRRPTMSGRASFWSKSQVNHVLERKQVYGLYENRGLTVENYYPAIVSKQDYQKACAVKKHNRVNNSSNKKGVTNNLLTGIPICGCCGYRVGYMRSGGGYQYLYCSSRKSLGVDYCDLPLMRYEPIEAILCVLLGIIELRAGSTSTESSVEKLQSDIDLMAEQLIELKSDAENLIKVLSKVTTDELINKLEQIELQKNELISTKVETEHKLSSLINGTVDESVIDTIKDISKRRNDPEFRTKIQSALKRSISNFVFNIDGSIDAIVADNKIKISDTKGKVQISVQNKVVEFELSDVMPV